MFSNSEYKIQKCWLIKGVRCDRVHSFQLLSILKFPSFSCHPHEHFVNIQQVNAKPCTLSSNFATSLLFPWTVVIVVDGYKFIGFCLHLCLCGVKIRSETVRTCSAFYSLLNCGAEEGIIHEGVLIAWVSYTSPFPAPLTKMNKEIWEWNVEDFEGVNRLTGGRKWPVSKRKKYNYMARTAHFSSSVLTFLPRHPFCPSFIFWTDRSSINNEA